MADEDLGKKVRRVLVVKAVGFKAGSRKGWSPPRIEDVLIKAMGDAPEIKDRHMPAVPAPDAEVQIAVGTPCAFINRIRMLPKLGCIFEVCFYTHGHVPEGFNPDLSQSEATIEDVVVSDDNGNSRELVVAYRCIAYGQIIIIETARGAGGTEILADLLTSLFRIHVDPAFPRVCFYNIGSSDLAKLIKDRGGVERIVANITTGTVISADSVYAPVLGHTRDMVGGTNRFSVTWANDEGNLSATTAIEMIEESEADHLNGVTVHFRLGGSISDLSTYRERRKVWVQKTDRGRPAVSEIEAALLKYLGDLRKAKQPIDADGKLVKAKLIEKN